MRKIIIALGLLLLALGERLWFDMGPNVELVMVSSVLAAVYLGRSWGVMVALLALALSDLVLGNTVIMIFTWSAFGLIAWLGRQIGQWQGGKRVLLGAGYGAAGAMFFYLYTNFGVWLVGNLYPLSLAGLMQSYIMGLPFLKIHVVSSVLLLSGGFALAELISEIVEWSREKKLTIEL